MNRKRCPILVLFLVIGFELLFRIFSSKELKYEVLDKQAHCFHKDKIKIVLCPNFQGKFESHLNFSYVLTTDKNSKRITPNIVSKKTYWVIGDSLSMGYGVDDRSSFPYVLSQKLQSRVENLAVDSMGSLAIQEIFQESLEIYPKPKAVFWIFSVSDFTDDRRFLKLKENRFYRFFFQFQFFLRKYSYLLNYVKILFEKGQPSKGRSNLSQKRNPKEDITYQSLLEIDKQCKRRGIRFYLMFAPDMNIQTGKFEKKEGTKELLQNFLINHQIEFINLKSHFYQFPNFNYYIKNDGHYSTWTNWLFADYAYRKIQQENLKEK